MHAQRAGAAATERLTIEMVRTLDRWRGREDSDRGLDGAGQPRRGRRGASLGAARGESQPAGGRFPGGGGGMVCCCCCWTAAARADGVLFLTPAPTRVTRRAAAAAGTPPERKGLSLNSSTPTRVSRRAAAAAVAPPQRNWLAYALSTPLSQTQEPASMPAVFPFSQGLFVGGGAWAMAGGIAYGAFC